MERKKLAGGRLIEAGYDEAERTLEIVFNDLSVKRFKPVPYETWKRFSMAPNPASFYEDRIAEEYPSVNAAKLATKPGQPATPMDAAAAARSKLDDLFGKK